MSTLDSQSTGDNTDTGDNMSTTSSVPKLMLKLNSPRPNTPDTQKKTWAELKWLRENFNFVFDSFQRKADDFEFPSPSSHEATTNRDPSPELVRISPLVTRPPKPKPTSKYKNLFIIWILIFCAKILSSHFKLKYSWNFLRHSICFPTTTSSDVYSSPRWLVPLSTTIVASTSTIPTAIQL